MIKVINSLDSSSAPPLSDAPPEALTPERKLALIRPLPISPSKLTYPSIRPDWWDGIHRSLKIMAEQNQQKMIIESSLLYLNQIADNVVERKNEKEIFMFLKLISEFMLAQTKEIFFRVLHELRLIHPKYDQLFQETECTDPAMGPSLAIDAISDLFVFFEETFHYASGVLSMQNLSKLPQLVSEFIHSPTETMRGWVIRNDFIEKDIHVVPVFIIKYAKQSHLFIFDSIGHDVSYPAKLDQLSLVLRWLVPYFNKRFKENRLIQIYSSKIKRQNSPVGCATFSVHDLKSLYERHANGGEHIVDFYTKQTEENQPKPFLVESYPKIMIWELNILPPELMKPMQSITCLTKYEQNTPIVDETSAPSFERLLPSGEKRRKRQTLESFWNTINETIRVVSPSQMRNCYLEKKRMEDIVILITRVYDRIHPSKPMPIPRKLVF